MLVNGMINESYRISIALKNKDLQTIIAILTENKVIELFCMTDAFCLFCYNAGKIYTKKTHEAVYAPFNKLVLFSPP